LTGTAGKISDMAINPDGDAASGGDDAVLRLWNFDTANSKEAIAPSSPITSVTFSYSGQILANVGCHRLSGSYLP